MHMCSNRIKKFFTLPSSTARSSRHVFPVRGLPSQIPSPSSRRLRICTVQNPRKLAFQPSQFAFQLFGMVFFHPAQVYKVWIEVCEGILMLLQSLVLVESRP